MSCDHYLVAGLGMFGDALTCTQCGASMYPEAIDPRDLQRLERRGRVDYAPSPLLLRRAELAMKRREYEERNPPDRPGCMLALVILSWAAVAVVVLSLGGC